MATTAAATSGNTKVAAPVLNAEKLSPTQYGASPLFGKAYPAFYFLRTFYFGTFLVLMILLLGLEPPQSTSTFRYIMHYSGYAIFAFMWWRISRVAKQSLMDIGVNNAIATYSAHRIDEARREIRTSGRKIKLDDLLQFFPDNNSEPAMLRLLMRIWQDAQSWRLDSLASVIAPYQRESYALRLKVENLQRISLRLGILGAFIGLVLALQDLQKLSGGAGSLVNLDAFLPGFLGALYLKFGASIGGLGASLYAYLQTSAIDKSLAKYFRNMEAATSGLLDLAAQSLKYSAFAREFDQIRGNIKDLHNELHDQSKRLEAVTDNLGKLAEVRTQISSFTSSLDDKHNKFLSDMQNLYNSASMERVFKSLETSLISINKQNLDAISSQFRTGLGSVGNNFGQIKAAMDTLANSVSRVYIWTTGVAAIAIIASLAIWFFRNH
jgi:methyl-accepting chemotaxis protein